MFDKHLEIFEPSCIWHLRDLPYEEIVDVRSPSEYERDHLDRAMNCPVLDDQQREEVGTNYRQLSAFRARRLGATLIARNIANILENEFADKLPSFRPLIYCWRGGQRSGALAEICHQVGWRTAVLSGGYRTYRGLVCRFLYEEPLPFQLVLLGGNTGTAKTEILQQLASFGIQIIDLEDLANHRGSVFGAVEGKQPSQRAFESGLVSRLLELDVSKPVFLEAESNRIGSLTLPPSLWKAMRNARRFSVSAPLAERVKFVVEHYQHLTRDGDHLQRMISKLDKFHSRKQLARWLNFAEEERFHDLVGSLMEQHYDPLYGRYVKRSCIEESWSIALKGLAADEIAEAAERIAERMTCLETSQGN